MTTWATRQQKALVRAYQLDVPGPRKHALFLPGWDTEANTGCLCIEQALKMGTIDQHTQITAAERNPEFITSIQRKLSRFGFSKAPIFHKAELHNLKLTKKIDYAMFDLLGTLGNDLVEWLRKSFLPQTVSGTSVAFTFTEFWRNNPFMECCEKGWQKPEFHSLVIDTYDRYGINDWNLLLHLLILKSVFNGFSFEYRRAHRYRDNVQTMCAFRLDNLQRLANPSWPSLQDVLSQQPRRIVIMPKTLTLVPTPPRRRG